MGQILPKLLALCKRKHFFINKFQQLIIIHFFVRTGIFLAHYKGVFSVSYKGEIMSVACLESLKTILILDDNELLLRMWGRLFDGEDGFRLLLCRDAEQALECLKLEDIHLVLSDVVMPGMNGFHFAKNARLLDPDLKIVMTSSYLENFSDTMLEGPPLIFIKKPYENIEEVFQFLKCHAQSRSHRFKRSELHGNLAVYKL